MESSRIPFLEEWLLFRRGIVMRGKTRGEEKDLSAQRIQFNINIAGRGVTVALHGGLTDPTAPAGGMLHNLKKKGGG